MKKGKCTTCRFYTELCCTVGTYYAEKGQNALCYEGELWQPLNDRTTDTMRFRPLALIQTLLRKASHSVKRCVKLKKLNIKEVHNG